MRKIGSKDKEPRLRTRLDFVSRIMMHMKSDDPRSMDEMLEGHDLKRWKRIRFVHSLNMQHGVELSHKEKYRIYKREIPEITGNTPMERTYFQDQMDCRAIFGPMLIPDLTYLRGIELEIAIRDRSLCRAAGDYKSVVALSKHIMELMGLDKAENKEPDDTTNKQVIVALQINAGDGSSRNIPLDLDRLNKLRPADLNALSEMIDSPSVGMEEMAKMLNLDGTDTSEV